MGAYRRERAGRRRDTGNVPGFVDPRPHQEAELRAKREALEAVTDEEERTRLAAEIRELEQALGRGGLLRRLLWGFGHRSVPW